MQKHLLSLLLLVISSFLFAQPIVTISTTPILFNSDYGTATTNPTGSANTKPSKPKENLYSSIKSPSELPAGVYLLHI